MHTTSPAGVRQNGAAIREIRTREGLSIAGLAHRLTEQGVPISEPHLRNIENELKNASVPHLAAIARALGATLASIRANPHALEDGAA